MTGKIAIYKGHSEVVVVDVIAKQVTDQVSKVIMAICE